MIVDSSTSRDSKRSQNGFPVVSSPDAQVEHDELRAGPSNEPPPPTYEEAVSAMEASSVSASASSRAFAPSRSSSKPTATPTSGSVTSQDKYAPPRAGTSTLSPDPYANPAVTGYGASGPMLSSSESSLGRHSSVASYYAPSTSSGKSRPDSGFAPSSTASYSSSGDNSASQSVARSCSTSTTHTSISSSRASNPSQAQSTSPSISSGSAPADGSEWNSQPQPQPPTSPSTRGASFARAPANNLPYGSFPPATLHAYSDDLEPDGFPTDPPTCACACAPAPHPFVTHDVGEEDWAAFLDDVRGAGGLSPVNSLIAGAAPIAVRAGIIGGIIAGHALRAHMKSKRKSPVADIIDEWNRKFFHPRCMDVVLAQGMIAYTGPAKAVPPDMAWRARENAAGLGKHVKAYEDTSDDENSYSPRGIPGMAAAASAGRQLGRLDSTVKGRGKCSRIALSQDLKASAGERWRLVVSYNPPVL